MIVHLIRLITVVLLCLFNSFGSFDSVCARGGSKETKPMQSSCVFENTMELLLASVAGACASTTVEWNQISLRMFERYVRRLAGVHKTI